MALQTSVLRVRRARVRAEIAQGIFALALGLMFRARLARDRGMLLCFGRDARHSIHMMNVRFPLDLLFLDTAGRIVAIRRARPGDWPFRPGRPARFVLEVPGGFCRRHGVRTGDLCRLPRALLRDP